MKRYYNILLVLAFIGLSGCVSDEGEVNGAAGDGAVSMQMSDRQVEFKVGDVLIVNTKSSVKADTTAVSVKVDSSEVKTLDSMFFVTCEPFVADSSSVTGTKAVAVDAANFSSFFLNVTSGTGDSMVHSNKVFSKEGDIYKGQMFWPSTDCGFHFYASNVAMKSGSDFSKVECPSDVDVVCAGIPSPVFQQRNTFSFTHVYGRVGDISMVVAPGLTATFRSGTIKASRSGVYDIKTGTWSSKSAPVDVALQQTNDIYLVPGEYDASITFNLSDGMTTKENVTREGKLTITANCVNKITVQVNDVFGYSMAMSPESVNMNVKDVEDFQAILTTTLGGSVVSQNNVSALDGCVWAVDDPTVLSLVAKGSVKALKGGTTKVRATYRTKSCEASVTATDFIETYGAITGLSISTGKVIPASGGSVGKDDITISGTCTQAVTYASGAVSSIEIALADLTKTWSATVTASTLGSEVHNSDFKVGTMTLTYSANGKSNTASCDVMQGKNVVTNTTYEIGVISSSITSVGNAGRSNIGISGGAGTKTETFTSGGTKATSFEPNKKIEIYNGSGYQATDQASITSSGGETKVEIKANSSYVKRQFRITYYYTGATSRTVDIEQEAGADSVNHYGAPTGLTITCGDIPASGGGLSGGTISGTVTQYAYYNSAPTTPVLVSPSPDYTVVGWEFRASADNKTTVSSLGTTETSRRKVGKMTLTYKANDVVGTAVCDVYQAANVKTHVGETTYETSNRVMKSIVLSYGGVDYTYMSGGTVQKTGVLFVVAREGGKVYVSGSYTYTKTPIDNYTYTATGSTLHSERGTSQTGLGKDILLDYTSTFSASDGGISWDAATERYVVDVYASYWSGVQKSYNVCVYLTGGGCLSYHPMFNVQAQEAEWRLQSISGEVNYPGMQDCIYYGQTATLTVKGHYTNSSGGEKDVELTAADGVTLSSSISGAIAVLDGLKVKHNYLNLTEKKDIKVEIKYGGEIIDVIVVFGERYYDALEIGDIEEGKSELKPRCRLRWNDTKEWTSYKVDYTRWAVGNREFDKGVEADASDFPNFKGSVYVYYNNENGEEIYGVIQMKVQNGKWYIDSM